MTAIALDHQLTHGARSGTLEDLAARWRMDTIELVLPGMAGFAASPSLGNKLRGALGAVLLDSASAAVRTRRPCDWPHTSTAEIFFGRRPLICLGDHSSEIAKPFVIEAMGRQDGALLVRLRVFGMACERTNTVADALVAAVRDQVRWDNLAKDGPRFLPARVEPSVVEVKSGEKPDANRSSPAAVELVFLTPLDADRGDAAFDPAIVLDRIVRRVALIAPWHGMSLADGYDDLIAAAHDVDADRVELSGAPSAETGGHRLENRLSPPMTIRLSGLLQPIWPALLIGEVAHVGRGASLGLGRYRLTATAHGRTKKDLGIIPQR